MMWNLPRNSSEALGGRIKENSLRFSRQFQMASYEVFVSVIWGFAHVSRKCLFFGEMLRQRQHIVLGVHLQNFHTMPQ